MSLNWKWTSELQRGKQTLCFFYSALLSTTTMCFCVSEIPKHHSGQQMQTIPEPSWIPGWVTAAESHLSTSELLEATTFSWGVLWYSLPVDTRCMCRPPQVTYKASFCHRLQFFQVKFASSVRCSHHAQCCISSFLDTLFSWPFWQWLKSTGNHRNIPVYITQHIPKTLLDTLLQACLRFH